MSVQNDDRLHDRGRGHPVAQQLDRERHGSAIP